MKTIDELSKLDKEIMEREYVRSYRRPPVLVVLGYFVGFLMLIGLFMATVYGLVGLLFQLML